MLKRQEQRLGTSLEWFKWSWFAHLSLATLTGLSLSTLIWENSSILMTLCSATTSTKWLFRNLRTTTTAISTVYQTLLLWRNLTLRLDVDSKSVSGSSSACRWKRSNRITSMKVKRRKERRTTLRPKTKRTTKNSWTKLRKILRCVRLLCCTK